MSLSPTAAELLDQLRASYGDALADQLTALSRETPAGQERVPVVLEPAEPTSPESYWVRAEALLSQVRHRLGTLYGPLVAILTLAQLHAREDRASSRFVAPLWVVAGLCGLSRDRTEEILQEHREVLGHFCYRKAWATSYRPTAAAEGSACSRWGGQLFVVPLPAEAYDEDVLKGTVVRGWRAAFVGRYRNLTHDVQRRFTASGWAGRLASVRARYGASRDPGLPTDSRLALLTQLVNDRFGQDVAAMPTGPDTRLRSVHEVLDALKEGPPSGRDGVARWAQQVADGLGHQLGDPSRTRIWLSLCWAAWRVSRAGLADGFRLLHDAAFEALVRRSDLAARAGPSQGATFNWIVNSLGLRQLDRDVRRILLPRDPLMH